MYFLPLLCEAFFLSEAVWYWGKRLWTPEIDFRVCPVPAVCLDKSLTSLGFHLLILRSQMSQVFTPHLPKKVENHSHLSAVYLAFLSLVTHREVILWSDEASEETTKSHEIVLFYTEMCSCRGPWWHRTNLSVGSAPPWFTGRVPTPEPWDCRWCLPLLWDAGPHGSRGMIHMPPVGFSGPMKLSHRGWELWTLVLASHVGLGTVWFCKGKVEVDGCESWVGAVAPQGLWGFPFPAPDLVLRPYCELLFPSAPWAVPPGWTRLCGNEPVCGTLPLQASGAPGAGGFTSPSLLFLPYWVFMRWSETWQWVLNAVTFLLLPLFMWTNIIL